MSLDRTVAAYDAKLAQLVADEAYFLATLPRLSATAEVAGDEIVLRTKYDGDAPGRIVCAVPKEAGLLAGRVVFPAGEDGAIRLPRSIFPGRTVRYLLGWGVEGMRLPMFEPWVEAEL